MNLGGRNWFMPMIRDLTILPLAARADSRFLLGAPPARERYDLYRDAMDSRGCSFGQRRHRRDVVVVAQVE
jgi:hypothetical protein